MCKSLFVNLGGGGGSLADGILQTPAALSSSFQVVKDNLGNSSILNLSTSLINIGSGTITNNGILTIKSAGSNILSLRNSSNTEVGSVSNSGAMSLSSDFTLTGNIIRTSRGRINWYGGDGVMTLTNTAENDFTALNFGGTGASNVALRVSTTKLQTKLADNSAFAVMEMLSILTQKPANSNAQNIKFGDKSTLTDAGLTALGFNMQWEVEIAGSSYWFPGKTTAWA